MKLHQACRARSVVGGRVPLKLVVIVKSVPVGRDWPATETPLPPLLPLQSRPSLPPPQLLLSPLPGMLASAQVPPFAFETGLQWPGGSADVPLDRAADRTCDPGLAYSPSKQRCEVPRSVRSRLQTEVFLVTLRKPGNRSTITFTTQVEGEDSFGVTVSSSIVRCARNDDVDNMACQVLARREFPHSRASAYGLLVEWPQKDPANHTQVPLFALCMVLRIPGGLILMGFVMVKLLLA